MFLFTSKVITQNGYTAQCSVPVITSITSLAVSPTSKTLNIGETVQLTGTVTPTSTTEGVQWASSNTNVATVSSSGLVTAKSAGTATITFKNSSSTKYASCMITVSYVGYYADIDGDGTVDGIIFADLLNGKTGQWMFSDATYTIPAIESTKVKSYKVSQEDYTDQLGGTSKILTPLGDGNDRFYIMALTDVGTYALASSMSGTSTAFGSGKANTQTLIERMKLDSSLKKAIQQKVNKGWFIPSKEEWSAFAGELGINRSNYGSKGLEGWYWSSSQYYNDSGNAWRAGLSGNTMHYFSYGHYTYARLATTF